MSDFPPSILAQRNLEPSDGNEPSFSNLPSWRPTLDDNGENGAGEGNRTLNACATAWKAVALPLGYTRVNVTFFPSTSTVTDGTPRDNTSSMACRI